MSGRAPSRRKYVAARSATGCPGLSVTAASSLMASWGSASAVMGMAKKCCLMPSPSSSEYGVVESEKARSPGRSTASLSPWAIRLEPASCTPRKMLGGCPSRASRGVRSTLTAFERTEHTWS